MSYSRLTYGEKRVGYVTMTIESTKDKSTWIARQLVGQQFLAPTPPQVIKMLGFADGGQPNNNLDFEQQNQPLHFQLRPSSGRECV